MSNNSFIDLVALESEFDVLVQVYHNLHKKYICSIKNNNKAMAATYDKKLTSVNDKLVAMLSQMQSLTQKIYPKGELDQNKLTTVNHKIIKMNQTLKNKKKELDNQMRELETVEGQLQNSGSVSNLGYVLMMMCTIFFVYVVIYSIKSEEQTKLELFILIAIVSCIIYNLFIYIKKKIRLK